MIKFTTLIVIFLVSKNVLALASGYCFLICIFLTMTYQHVVAAIVHNTIVLAPMDHQTFISDPKSFVHYMNCSTYTGDSEDAIIGNFKKAFEIFPKFRYKVKEIAGDYYYEMMSIEETCQKMFL